MLKLDSCYLMTANLIKLLYFLKLKIISKLFYSISELFDILIILYIRSGNFSEYLCYKTHLCIATNMEV
jgi:hypothetical protein